LNIKVKIEGGQRKKQEKTHKRTKNRKTSKCRKNGLKNVHNEQKTIQKEGTQLKNHFLGWLMKFTFWNAPFLSKKNSGEFGQKLIKKRIKKQFGGKLNLLLKIFRFGMCQSDDFEKRVKNSNEKDGGRMKFSLLDFLTLI